MLQHPHGNHQMAALSLYSTVPNPYYILYLIDSVRLYIIIYTAIN